VTRERFLLRGARLFDPPGGVDERGDLLVADGRIADIGSNLDSAGVRILELEGLLLTPGLVDIHAHLREPGQETKETIATGAAAAAAGGFTTVCAMPNTDPVIDSPDRIMFVRRRGQRAGAARVLPIAAATRGSEGLELTDTRALSSAGAVALSDDGRPIATAAMLARVLAAAKGVGIVVADHCEDPSISCGGVVRAGSVADQLGVRGVPAEAESAAVARDLEVLAEVGGRLHLCHLSTASSVNLVRAAKEEGLAVTCETTPHHLVATDRLVLEVGADAKMNPPLGGEEDRLALRLGLADGTIDCVATDHAPHTEEEKARGIAEAPFGVVGLETAFALLFTELVLGEAITLEVLVDRLTGGPRRAYGLAAERLAPGSRADLTVFDLEAEWTVDPKLFRSKGRNTPFAGWPLKGRPVLTLVEGRITCDVWTNGTRR
jgi:dihydroorotase